ncbi:EamA family transporter, partial [Streptomyces massasporeus]
ADPAPRPRSGGPSWSSRRRQDTCRCRCRCRLGYFINPLVTIALGVLVLQERLRPAQWAAVGIGFAAVLVLAIGYGQPPWISLTLAFSFAVYGLAKKKVNIGGLESLAAETAVQFLPALGYLVWLGTQGTLAFGSHGAGHTALLAATGIVTAVPLVCFGAAAIRVPLSTLGLLQYLAPTFQFLLGVLYFHEEMPPERWAGFSLVWLALTILTWDALRTARRSRAAMEAAKATAGAAAGTEATAGVEGAAGTEDAAGVEATAGATDPAQALAPAPAAPTTRQAP